jgi:hypothetical protein
MSDLAAYGAELADAICARLPTWVVSSVDRVMVAWSGRVPPEVAEAAEDAAREALDDIGTAMQSLLAASLEEQRTTPLTLLRRAVVYPTRVLHDAGVPPVVRDRFSEEAFPDDVYDLSPASFADFSPDLAELGIKWGAAKAFEHRRLRHGSSPEAEG